MSDNFTKIKAVDDPDERLQLKEKEKLAAD